MRTQHGLDGEVSSEAFGIRLATLLRRRRRDLGLSRRRLARGHGVDLPHRQLRALERGETPLDEIDLDAVAMAYQVDLAVIFAARTELEVDLRDGVLTAAGVSERFVPGDDTTLCTAYLRLVRQLRRQPSADTLPLRREDIEVLASVLRTDAGRVIEQLGALMGATVTQRRAAVTAFSAGAAMILLATGAAATPTGPAEQPIAVVATVEAADTLDAREAGDAAAAAVADQPQASIPADGVSQGPPPTDTTEVPGPVDDQRSPVVEEVDAPADDRSETEPATGPAGPTEAGVAQPNAPDVTDVTDVADVEDDAVEEPAVDVDPEVALAPPQFHVWDDELGPVPGDPQAPDGEPAQAEQDAADDAVADETVELAPPQRHEWDDEHGAVEVDPAADQPAATADPDLVASPDEPVELAQPQLDVADKPA